METGTTQREAAKELDESDAGRPFDAAGQKRRDADSGRQGNSEMSRVGGQGRERRDRQRAAETAGRASGARVRMMLAACRTVVLKMGTGVIAGLVGHHRGMAVMLGHCTSSLLMRGRHIAHGMRGAAFHGDGRERLSRKAEHEQHDNEEFAPVRHGYGV